MISGLVIFLAILIVYLIIAVSLGKRSITMPIFFLVVGAILGLHGLEWMNILVSTETIKILVEVTLALILFSDASKLKFNEV